MFRSRRRINPAFWLIVLVLPSAGCTTGISILAATEFEQTSIEVEQVRAQRFDRGWQVEIRWVDGEESDLEWTPMGVLDQGPVHRTAPRVVPRQGWFDHDAARNGLWHTDSKLLLFKDGQQVATYPIRRVKPVPATLRYAILAGVLPFALALDAATLPLQLIGGGIIGLFILTSDDDEDGT